MDDVLFKTDEYVFSYRAAGICLCDGQVLLQKPANDEWYSFPGGHVAFGETNSETLAREFKEEINADVEVGELKWVGEIFFPWGDKSCHQICLYYIIKIVSDNIPCSGLFHAVDELDICKVGIDFCWISVEEIGKILIAPTNVQKLLLELIENPESGVKHFIYRE